MINKTIIYQDDYVGESTGIILDKVLMQGKFEIKFWRFTISYYSPVTYYAVVPRKGDKVNFIRAGQVKRIVT